MGISITSGGIGKKELSANETMQRNNNALGLADRSSIIS